MSAWACARPTFGFRRASTYMKYAERVSSSAGVNLPGTHNEAVGLGNRKSAGTTPTTVCGSPLR